MVLDVVGSNPTSRPKNKGIRVRLWWVAIAMAVAGAAQDPAEPPLTTSQKWDHFKEETATPFTLGAGAFNAIISQATRSTPLYGRTWSAYPKRFGASVGDIVSQNFFGDFMLASALHEDPRYFRMGPTHKLWPRVGHAIGHAIITRTDSGSTTFNWSNVVGTGMSAGLSNAYYPAASQTALAAGSNWGTSVAGSGLANLMPEFWPDFKGWMKRRFSKH